MHTRVPNVVYVYTLSNGTSKVEGERWVAKNRGYSGEREREGEDRGRNGRVGVMHKIVYIRVNARHLAGWRGRKGSNEWTSERFRFGSVRSSLV